MSFSDALFWLLWLFFLISNLTVLYQLRNKPLYEPRVIFSLAALLWLVIGYGYSIGFEGYLAAKENFYNREIQSLALESMVLLLVGYFSFIIGASAFPARIGARYHSCKTDSIVLLAYIMVLLAVINFMVNVFLISHGDLLSYLFSTAGRKYQVTGGAGVSAIGYLFGFIAAHFLCYAIGFGTYCKKSVKLIIVIVLMMLMIKLSQGRIFQTLVFIGACYASYNIGSVHRTGKVTPFFRHLKYLFYLAIAGVVLYFLRIASAVHYMGRSVGVDDIAGFLSNFTHFAVERGNVPNFPVLFTLLDKIPNEEGYLYGASLFNWLLYGIPKSILPADYLISIWIKNTWYLDVPGGGLPPTAIGEWYANFGYPGVVFGMFVIGALMRLIFNKAMSSPGPLLAVLWANLAFGFLVIYPKTDLAQLPVFTFMIISMSWFGAKLLNVLK